MSKPNSIVTVMLTGIFVAQGAAAAEKIKPEEKANASRVLPEETASKDSLPPEQRLQPIYEQDDHIHYTPDQAFNRFEKMDADNNREVTWDEAADHTDQLQYKEFKRLDTDGSGTLDRGEYIGIAPDHRNNYKNDESLQE